MANAAKDNNGVSSLIAVLDTNGSTIVRVKADPSTHRLKVADASTGSDLGPTNAAKDQNFVSTLIAVSRIDGSTPVVVYCDSSGNLLVDSN